MVTIVGVAPSLEQAMKTTMEANVLINRINISPESDCAKGVLADWKSILTIRCLSFCAILSQPG